MIHPPPIKFAIEKKTKGIKKKSMERIKKNKRKRKGEEVVRERKRTERNRK